MVLSNTETLYKFGSMTPEDHPWVYGNVWAIEDRTNTYRLVIAPAADHVKVLEHLIEVMPEPMWLLYLLVVPRGNVEAGRYQSNDPQSRQQVRDFLQEFRVFLEADGRHNLWIRSVASTAMLVYDRHSLIYAYGLTEVWKPMLQQFGMNEVAPASIEVPDPHSHHYNAAFDIEERRILGHLDWSHTPIREGDER
jgi:hypothetical protein